MTKRSPTARPHADRIPRVPVGPLAPMVLEESSEWLAAQGYSSRSAAGIVNLLERLSSWMREVAAGVDDIDEDLLARFVAAERVTTGSSIVDHARKPNHDHAPRLTGYFQPRMPH